MPKASLEELKGQIAAGEYAVDSRKLAGVILADLALIRRVRRLLMTDQEGRPGRRAPPTRRSRLGVARLLRTRRERLQ